MVFEDNLKPYELKNFEIKTLQIKSESLKENPLGDSFVRNIPVLVPKKQGGYNCVFHLSGFTSNAQKNFNFKSYEQNLIEEIDEWTMSESISPKIYVFVDAWTSWGGSQFINSEGCGKYEDYIVKELVPFVEKSLKSIDYSVADKVVLGGSSGGYGALHLCSKFPEVFPHCLAIAPDCDFEVSLKHEVYQGFADIMNQDGPLEILNKIKGFDIKTNQRSFHTMVNVLAMAACYSKIDENNMPILPLEKEGGFDQDLWSKWLEKDPVHFLPKRLDAVKSLKTIFLSVGEFDQFLLQYGVRKIRKLFKENEVGFIYEEFKGNHFDIGTRRKKALSLV
ncbi:MAG: alpha/beta hydrolase-fold protein [Bdellovibrionales bacterium]